MTDGFGISGSFVKIANEQIGDALLESVEVTQELNRHAWCHVVYRQTRDERFPVEEILGNSLEVITSDDDGTEIPIFDGFILKTELEYESWRSFTAHNTAVTRSYKLALTEQHA